MRWGVLLLCYVCLIFAPIATIQAQDEQSTGGAGDTPVITVENAADIVELALLSGHTEAVTGVAFSPDSETLVSVSDDASLRVWQVASGGEITALFDHISFVKDVAFAPADDDTFTLASVGWGRTLLLHQFPADDPAAIEQTAIIEGFIAVMDRVAYSPDGTQIAATVGNGTVVLLDAQTQERTGQFALSGLQMNAVAFSPDGSLLAAASGFPSTDAYVFTLDADNTEPAYITTSEGTMTALGFIPASEDRGTTLVSVDDTGVLNLWTLGDGEAVLHGTASVADTWLLALALSPAGDLLVTGDLAGNLRLWDLRDATPTQIAMFSIGEEVPVFDIAISPDGTLIAAAGQDGTVRLWGLPLSD